VIKNDLLELNFLTDTGSTVTVSVKKPLLTLTEEQIKTAMEGMVVSGAYKSAKNGGLVAPYSAVLNIVNVTKLI